MSLPDEQNIHNKYAPYWALALVILCGIGLLTGVLDYGKFWKGYVLDIAGPAWSYILFRNLFRKYTDNQWTRIFTPIRTYTLFLIICFGIENMQYLGLYESTFDSWDYVAYISVLTPIFVLDLLQTAQLQKHSNDE